MTSIARERVPVELYRPILSHIEHWKYFHRLHVFSYVCKSWKKEVEYLMYWNVTVPDKGILYFCRTMFERPDLARRIRRLFFTAAGHRKRLEGDPETVSRMFKLLVNLKELSFVESPTYEVPDWVLKHTDYSILSDVPFQLERFETHFWWQQPLVDFLSTQPGLREFAHAGGTHAAAQPEIPPHALLQCNFLRISPHIISGFRKPRNVSHMRLDFWRNSSVEEAMAARSLRYFGQHLKCLCISRIAGDGYDPTCGLLDIMSKRAPGLTVLGVYEDIDYSAAENKRILRTLSKNLKNLQVFVWAPLFMVPNSDEDFSSDDGSDVFDVNSDDDSTSPQKIKNYAQAFMDACPSLQYFISFRKGELHGWIRTKEGSVKEYPPMVKATEDCFPYVDPSAPLEYFLNCVIREPRFAYIPGKSTPENSPHFYRRVTDHRHCY